MDTPSALALALTLLLALLSALAFVLIYLRSPWAASAAVARGNNKSHLHSHSHPGSHAHHNHSHGPGPTKHSTVGSGAHAHAHTAGGGDSANSHGSSALLNGSNGNSTNGAGGNSNNLTAAQLAALSAASSSSSSSVHNHSSGLAPGLAGSALTAADIALRGRKAKKRGGRVHVMLGNSGNGSASGGGGGSSSSSGGLGSGLSSLSSSIASPASSSSRGRGNSLASPSPYVFPLDFLSVAPPVVVCLTTLPSRVHHIDKCLNSIKTQNYPIAQMMLAIPEESRRERTKYSIPDRVRKDAIINVVRVSHDYGPATRLITAWSSLPDDLATRDTLLITLDDDMIYHPDTVATLVRHALAHPDSAVAFAGYSLRGKPFMQPNFQYARRREERPDLAWKGVQVALQNQISYAAASAAANHSTNSAALAAAAAAALHSPAHLSSHVIAPSLDPALLPCFDPIPDVALDSDPYCGALPNPNDVYETELVDVLCGWRGGMCVRKRFLDERMWRDYGKGNEAAMQADDEWISAQLSKNGVSRRVILAPFDMILGRLRLRHGRNSASASHLAYQQTLLEKLVDEKRMITCADAQQQHQRQQSRGGGSRSSFNGSSYGHRSPAAPPPDELSLDDLDAASTPPVDATAAAAALEAAAAQEVATMQRLSQLIQIIDVQTSESEG